MYLRFLCITLLIFFTNCARKNFFQEDALYTKNEAVSASPTNTVLVTAGKQYKRSRLHEIIWGRHYRQVWATPVPATVIDIHKIHGGLEPVKLGGGMQTTSLTLKDKAGKLYSLRTLDKDPSLALSKSLRNTFVANIMRDQTSAGNPYAAFTLPPLAQASKIHYTNPEMYYVPKNYQGLGEFSEKFRGKVVMLEEKYEGKKSLAPKFGNATDLVESDEMLRARFKSNKNSVDQLALARARLYDILIGDWDRHEGQWTWAIYPDKDNKTKVFYPVPKDRDQTFYRFADGIMPWLVSRKFLVQKLKPFRHNIEDVSGLIFNARFLDQRFLNEVTAEQWAAIAEDMKGSITDEVIQKTISLFPDPIQKIEGAKTSSKLKKRVDQLPEAAQDFYKILAKEVTIVGSDEQEMFTVKRIDNNTTSVEVFAIPEDKEENPRSIYYRVFNHQETKKLILHGLAEDDEFEIEGKVDKGIEIEIYGGLGEDKITDTSRVKGLKKKTKVFDTKNGTELKAGKETKDKTTKDVAVHAYDREGY
ncbi:hypothetical protein [Adhaeribacter aquaticus]|uniref:hypothetical protein n=1 Tax=Adhaeribacter aquaticus TaxID=299567 RepID=UPI0004790D8A|nr:hypothetical protein [Adhaeribacter aquaticus]